MTDEEYAKLYQAKLALDCLRAKNYGLRLEVKNLKEENAKLKNRIIELEEELQNDTKDITDSVMEQWKDND